MLSNNSLFPTGICCSVLPAYLKETCSEINQCQSSHLEVLLGEGVLKICSKFTGEQPYRSVISIKLITLLHECSPVNLLHIFRAPSLKNTSEWLLLLIFWKRNTYYWGKFFFVNLASDFLQNSSDLQLLNFADFFLTSTDSQIFCDCVELLVATTF